MEFGGMPQEIYEEIISYLHPSAPGLLAISLAHSSLRHLAQRRIFARITLYPHCTPRSHATAARLLSLLSASTHLATYITHLDLHLTADRTQWVGWGALVPLLPLLMRLQRLGVHADLPAALDWDSGFTPRATVDDDERRRIVDALLRTVRSPTLVAIDTHCVDITFILPYCVHLKALRLSAPIVPAHILCGRAEDNVVKNNIALDALRLENTFDQQKYDPRMLSRALAAQGVSLRHLRRLANVYHGGHRACALDELCGMLEACGDTLEELEINMRLTTEDLNVLARADPTAPSAAPFLPVLRVLHLHLHALDALDDPADLRGFIAALGALLHRLAPSSSQPPSSSSSPAPPVASALTRLVLTDHSTLFDHLVLARKDWAALLRDVLGDRAAFPKMRLVVWEGRRVVREVMQEAVLGALGAGGVGYEVQVAEMWSGLGWRFDIGGF